MKHLLSSSAFLIVNKQLAKQVGLKGAILLADLISKEEYFIANGMTDGWFFNTEANIERDTTLTSYQQRKCLKTLKNEGMIKTFLRGVPAKTHYKIVENKIWDFLKTSYEETSKPVIKEFKNLLLKNHKTINNNRIIIIDNNKEQQKAKAYFDDLDINNFL